MFLANENFPQPSIELIQSKGFEVVSIRKNHSGISDIEVIQIALKSKLIVLTFDKDYGEIIFKSTLSKPPAVVFFRDKGQNPIMAGETLLELLSSLEIKLENAFTVVEKNNIRQRHYK